MAAPSDRPGPDAGPAVAGWLAVPVLLAVAAIAGALLPGLVLAALGAFRPVVAAPAMIAGALLAGWAVWPAVRQPEGSAGAAPAAHAAAAAALAGVALLTALNLAGTGQWVLTDRDPGAVVTAAQWLADEGRLDMPAAPGPFGEVEFASAATAQGWFADGDRVAPQFMHGVHVALAAARWVGGPGAMFGLTALLSGLAALCLFVVAARFLPGWAAAGAAVSLAALAPQAYMARGPFSEPLAQLLLLGAAALLLLAAERGPARSLVMAGAVAGAVVAARVDGVMALAGLAAWLAARAVVARRENRRPGLEAAWVAAGVALAAVAVAADAAGPAGPYLRLHRSEVLSQLAVVGAVWVGAAAWYLVAVRRELSREVDGPGAIRPWRRTAGPLAAGSVVMVVAALWWVRPLVETTREAEPSLLVEALQRAGGLEVDPTRRYFEDSVAWLAWYLGPTGLVLAVLGLAMAVRACVVGRDPSRRLLLVLGLAALPTAAFVWRARTTPDQLWVMRRLVPATLPLVVALAWGAAAGIGPALRRWRPAVGRTVATTAAVAASAAIAVPVLLASAPVRAMSLQAGALDAVEDTCDALGPDAAVLALADEAAALLLPATLRSFCRLPVVGATHPVGRAALADLAGRWAVEGRRLHVVSDTGEFLQRLLGPVPVREFDGGNARQPEGTLTRRPDRLVRQDWRWALAAVDPP